MSEQRLINFHADGLRLTGTLHLPDAPRPPVVIGCHGLLADRRSPKQIGLAQACNRQGMAYLRFDHRGCSDSQGEFKAVTSLEGRTNDLRAALEAVRADPQLGPVAALFGSSFGGTVVLALACLEQPGMALVTFAAPIESAAISPSALTDAAGRPLPRESLPGGLEFDLAGQLGRIRRILVVHGDRDEIVPVAQARTLFSLAGSPKKILIQENGDHRMTDPRHQVEFERQVVAWIAQAF